MSANNLNGNSQYPEPLLNSMASSSTLINEATKPDVDEHLRLPPVLPLAPPVPLSDADTHPSKQPMETENVSGSPRKEYFLDASFGPTPSSYYFYSENYQNFDEELYTFEEFLGTPDTPKDDTNNKELDSVPIDSPRAGPSVERRLQPSSNCERSYTADIGNFIPPFKSFFHPLSFAKGDNDSLGFPFNPQSRQSNNADEISNFSSNVNNLPVADFAYAETNQASPEPLNLGPVPLPPRNQSVNIGATDEMGFLRIFCCLRPQNRASRYHAAAEEAPPATEELQSRPQYSW